MKVEVAFASGSDVDAFWRKFIWHLTHFEQLHIFATGRALQAKQNLQSYFIEEYLSLRYHMQIICRRNPCASDLMPRSRLRQSVEKMDKFNSYVYGFELSLFLFPCGSGTS